jgi:hypothetical protein
MTLLLSFYLILTSYSHFFFILSFLFLFPSSQGKQVKPKWVKPEPDNSVQIQSDKDLSRKFYLDTKRESFFRQLEQDLEVRFDSSPSSSSSSSSFFFLLSHFASFLSLTRHFMFISAVTIDQLRELQFCSWGTSSRLSSDSSKSLPKDERERVCRSPSLLIFWFSSVLLIFFLLSPLRISKFRKYYGGIACGDEVYCFGTRTFLPVLVPVPVPVPHLLFIFNLFLSTSLFLFQVL